MSKIFFTEPPISLDNLKPFQTTTHIIKYPEKEIENVHEFDRESLLYTLKNFQPDILVCGLKFQIDKEVLDSAPNKAVFTRTTGLDHIDTNYAKEKGIEVINLKGEELTDCVAVPELSIGMMIYMMRTLYNVGFELKGKTLGIIGFGRIGKILAEKAKAFGMNIITYDIKDKDSYNVSQAGKLEVLLESSDIVSLNITSNEENLGFLNLEKFKLMKDGAWFINSARPWLVEEEGFKWALNNKLAGAWVDFDLPYKNEFPNLICTNHIGGKTIESSNKTEAIIVNKLLTWLKEKQNLIA